MQAADESTIEEIKLKQIPLNFRFFAKEALKNAINQITELLWHFVDQMHFYLHVT